MIANRRTIHRNGFTFTEVLISLMICSLLVGTVCASLIHILRTEKRTTLLQDIPLHLQTLACRTYLNGGPQQNTTVSLPAKWLADSEEYSFEDEEINWTIWRLSPPDQPSFVSSHAVRSDVRAW